MIEKFILSMSSVIWVKVVGAGAESVTSVRCDPAVTTVDDLKKLVIAECPCRLGHIDALDLIVKGTGGVTIEEDALVSGRGEGCSKAKAFIVEVLYTAPPVQQVVLHSAGVNRMEKIIESLKKCNINTTDASVVSALQRLARNDRNLEVGSVSTDLALSTYENVKEAVGTETKSCIASKIGMKVNGSVFPDFPFILSAHDATGAPKLVKILRVADGTTSFTARQQDMICEAESVKFVHASIVPMERSTIEIDVELAAKANCRVGVREVLIMPWYTSTLDKHPSSCLDWIGIQGSRILDALQYLHTYPDGGYAHMDVKAMNIFVDHSTFCFLGDFGSCKPIGTPITSCSIAFCWEDVRNKPAHPKYDYFMLLVMILIECLEDRRTYYVEFYDTDAKFVIFSKIIAAAHSRIAHESTPGPLGDLLAELLRNIESFDFS